MYAFDRPAQRPAPERPLAVWECTPKGWTIRAQSAVARGNTAGPSRTRAPEPPRPGPPSRVSIRGRRPFGRTNDTGERYCVVRHEDQSQRHADQRFAGHAQGRGQELKQEHAKQPYALRMGNPERKGRAELSAPQSGDEAPASVFPAGRRVFLSHQLIVPRLSRAGKSSGFRLDDVHVVLGEGDRNAFGVEPLLHAARDVPVHRPVVARLGPGPADEIHGRIGQFVPFSR